MIWRITATYEAREDLRRDLYQDILLAIWRALPNFRGEAGLKTYIARIAHNRSVSHVAREASRPGMSELDAELPGSDPSPFDEAERNDRRRRLQHAVRALPLPLRQPVSLTLEGFGPAEIAAITGLTANTVSIRLTRAKAALRQVLGGDDD
ncbi:sigma-70 family RNA polymerase sigma factor [Parvularcula flava]|uniref:DNA-directed RNA polymerase sigma-70 factor n=1 Tax=Aquisalinus luteolus TaxID=1566827 RepID=A0A8J3ERY6_9PROT|nr:sigma-70 family RNA polymerase sigma factor [Aquisalinus luteolus]GGH99258.1 DNA-directed RNA polymerase sigma-70 factor [Aquisalinus luteolus]